MHSSATMQTLKFLSKVWVKCFHHLVNHSAWHFMRRSKCASASVFLGDGANRFVWELFVTAFQNIQLFILWEWQVFKCKGVQRELQLQLSRLGGGVGGSRLSSCFSLIFFTLDLLWNTADKYKYPNEPKSYKGGRQQFVLLFFLIFSQLTNI